MIIVRIIRGIAGVAGLGTLTLGLLFWITQIDIVIVHIVFGLTFALSLLVLSIVAVFTRRMSTRYLRLKSAAAKAAVPEATVSQFEK
jgi:hypothetical protein